MEVKLRFQDPEKCPVPLNRVVPSIEVTETNIMWTFFRYQILRPLNRGVPKERFNCTESFSIRLQNSRIFLKISKEISKVWLKSLTRAKRVRRDERKETQSRSLFSASFQTFCLTPARTWIRKNIRKNTDCFAVYFLFKSPCSHMCDDQVATFHAPQPMYIHLQNFQTDLHTFSWRISRENSMKDQSTFSLMIIVLILVIFFLDDVLMPLGEKLMSFILEIYLLFSLSSLQISIWSFQRRMYAL